MVPYAFLSLSSDDDAFVSSVVRYLPSGLAFFYKKSFENGESMISEMEKGVNNSALFALFVSARSLRSYWVNFEIDQARLRKITKDMYRVYVYPVDATVKVSQLPDWMRRYWVGSAGVSPRDIARHLRYCLSEPELALPAFRKRILGRGGLLDEATRLFYENSVASSKAPNVFVFAGIAGIGRRTFCEEFLRHALATLPALPRGPEVWLPQYPDLPELWRGLRDEIEIPSAAADYEQSWLAFGALSEEYKIDEITRSIKYLGDLGQAVKTVMGNGLFLDTAV